MERPSVVFGRSLGHLMLGAAVACAIVLLPSSPATARGRTQSFAPSVTPSEISATDDLSDLIEPADTLELTGLQDKFEGIARRVSPSVVSISAAGENPLDLDLAHREPAMTPQQLEATLEKASRTVGTGFAIDRGGYILTNEHVVGGCRQIWVTTDDCRVMSAVVVGSDPRADLAVLKVPTDSLPPVQIGDCQSLCRGQWTIALGNPLGLATEGQECMSVGVVAATGRSLPRLSTEENRCYCNLIQTTAQINPGSSGGPLFDINGRVIGINTAVILPQKNTSGIGFAIPLTSATLAEIRLLERGERVTYAYFGVSVVDPTAAERALAGLAQDAGVRVQSVEPQSPAAEASIQPGDLILRFGEQSVRDAQDFVRLASEATVNKPAELEICRGGKSAIAMIVPRCNATDDPGVCYET
ncbi:MAG TPA: trypsin-like peptidase domain-containing protein, partial [Tepidisphaeraceae bacterium]|nr:trypsin-like peptidase domain-containing protein [Tepidisphaeraceae bacterium]